MTDLLYVFLILFPPCFVSPTSATSSSTYISLYVSGECGVTLHEAMPCKADPHTPFDHYDRMPSEPFHTSFPHPAWHHIAHPEQHKRKLAVVYSDPSEGGLWVHVFANPRFAFLEGKLITAPKASPYVMYLPQDVREFRVYCHNESTYQIFSTARKFHTLSTTSAPSATVVPGVMQLVGAPETQFNLVFLSAGYQASDYDTFIADITTVFNLMKNPAAQTPGVSNVLIEYTVPWTRYSPFFNVFTVFQPSVDSGASITGGTQVNNNLDCTFPLDPTGTGLQCDMTLAVALAQASGARAIDNSGRTAVVCIVNTPRYGGTGLYLPGTHFASFSNYLIRYADAADTSSNWAEMISLVSHELGHAIGNLLDEYNIGVTEPDAVYRANCCLYDDSTLVPWAHWFQNATRTQIAYETVTSHTTSVTYAVSSEPLPVCGYSNYYKATPGCMMYELTDYYMCPVCREATTLMILGNSPIQFYSPQCPLRDQLIMISTTQPPLEVYLVLNTALVSSSDFSVSWNFGSIPHASCTDVDPQVCQIILLNSATASQFSGLVLVQVEIVHNPKWVVNETAVDTTKFPWYQTTSFQLYFYAGDPASPPNVTGYNASVTTTNCSIAPGLLPTVAYTSYSYRCNATPGAVCVLDVTAPPYLAPEDSVLLEEAAQYMYYVIVGIALLCIGLWVWALTYYNRQGKFIARPIFRTKFSWWVELISSIMTGTAMFLMMMSLGSLAFGLYYYGTLGPFGQIVLFAGIIISFLLYILAFTGYWAVKNRSKRVLLVNGVLLLVCFGLTVAGIGIMIQMSSALTATSATPSPSTNSTGSTADVSIPTSAWYEKLNTFWRWLVSAQPGFTCQAELYLQCTGWFYSCDSPRALSIDCPSCTQAVGKPWSPCQTLFSNYITSNYQIIFYALIVTVGAITLAVVFNFTLLVQIKRMKILIQILNQRRLQKAKAMKDSSRALLLLKSLNKSDTDSLLQEFYRMDVDGNGSLDRQEIAFFLTKALCHKPTKEELDKIFEVLDTDRSGNISLSEFMALFGVDYVPPPPKQPSIYSSFMRQTKLQPEASFKAADMEVPMQTQLDMEKRQLIFRNLEAELRHNGWEDPSVSQSGWHSTATSTTNGPRPERKLSV